MERADDVVVNVVVSKDKQEQTTAIQQRAETTLKACEVFEVETPGDFTLAAAQLRAIKFAFDAIDAHRKEMTRPIDEAKRKIMDKFKPALALLETAKGVLSKKMLVWKDAQERAARAEQQQLAEIARAKREKLEAEGRHAEAARTVAPVVAAAVPATPGVTQRRTWSAECFDVLALARAVLDGTVPPVAIEANQKFLNEQARSLEQMFDERYPGCRAVPTDSFARTR